MSKKIILSICFLTTQVFANTTLLSPFCRIGLDLQGSQTRHFQQDIIESILHEKGYELAPQPPTITASNRHNPRPRNVKLISDFIIESEKELCHFGRRSNGDECHKMRFYQKLPNTRTAGVTKHYLAHESTYARPSFEEIKSFVTTFPSCQKSGYHTRSAMFFDCRNFGKHRVHTAPVGAVCITRSGAQVKLIEKNGQKQIWQDLATQNLYSYGFEFINITNIADVITACSRLGENLTSTVSKSKKWQLTSNEDVLNINRKNIFEVLIDDHHQYTRVSLSPNNEVSDYYFGPHGLVHGPTVRTGGQFHSYASICIGK